MTNAYTYLDHDYSYVDPKTGVMRNLAGVTDGATLMLVESGAVSRRMNELSAKPIKIKNAETLLDIHRHLFQDVYEWAGKVRTVEISKGGKQFFSLRA